MRGCRTNFGLVEVSLRGYKVEFRDWVLEQSDSDEQTGRRERATRVS